MGRLLDEDEVIKIIDKYFDADECNGSDVAMDIMADISCLPSAQPDIIRCENCEYWDGFENKDFWYFQNCSLRQCTALSDDFCSWGKRREE